MCNLTESFRMKKLVKQFERKEKNINFIKNFTAFASSCLASCERKIQLFHLNIIQENLFRCVDDNITAH